MTRVPHKLLPVRNIFKQPKVQSKERKISNGRLHVYVSTSRAFCFKATVWAWLQAHTPAFVVLSTSLYPPWLTYVTKSNGLPAQVFPWCGKTCGVELLNETSCSLSPYHLFHISVRENNGNQIYNTPITITLKFWSIKFMVYPAQIYSFTVSKLLVCTEFSCLSVVILLSRKPLQGVIYKLSVSLLTVEPK